LNPARRLVVSFTDGLALPPVYRRIRQLMQTQETQVDHYVEAVATDLTLAERIVRLANSRFLGYRRSAHTLRQAISLIGAIQVHDLLLGSLCMRVFDNLPTQMLALDTFWRGNVFCGIAARNIGRQAMLPARERLFTLGLLHDIGHMVMFTQIPGKIQEALAIAADTRQPLHLVEQTLLGYHYGEVGAELAHYWQLPEVYSDTIGHHMEPAQATSHRVEKAIVNLARHLLLEQPAGELQATTLATCPGWQILQIPIQQLQQLRLDAEHWEDELLYTLRPAPQTASA